MGLQYVRCNVEDHRLLDGGVRCEDVTTFTPPTLEHPTTEVKSSGLVADINVPNMYHYNAMECSVAHNKGQNCQRLGQPGIHNLEFRAARQKYITATGEMDLELVKYRVTGIHLASEPGDIETDNPTGMTERYSILRYSEEIGGEEVTLIDTTSGIIRINGVDYGNQLSSLLD